jgi:NADH-quinone oxidoreductase subunit D
MELTPQSLGAECLQTDLTSWTIGPYHGALPGPMSIRLRLDGEVIVAGDVETGFLHRGLEKAFELQSWQSAVSYADRLDPEAAAFGELALCLAVEEIGEIVPPPRAQAIRVIVCELSRVSAHLGYLARMARAAGSETMVHYVLRDREKILDLFELLTGARFSMNFLRFGGVASDVTEGFIERVLEACDLVRVRLKEYNDLFSFNQAFLRRSAYIGTVDRALAAAHGMTGPNARSAGIAFDVRKAHPYSGYGQLDFSVPVGQGEGGAPGDAHDRFVIRLREIAQSLEILKEAADGIPSGDFSRMRVGRGCVVPAGEAYARVESARGMLGCHVVSGGGERPERVQFRAPSAAAVGAIPELIRGARLEDLPIILASLDIGVAEVDR